MATVANREGSSAMAKGLGGCAAMGTFFSIIDTIRNHSFHNFTSVCIFGFACWGLLKVSAFMKRPSFARVTHVRLADTVVGRAFGTPGWVRPALWAALFVVLVSLFVGLFRYRLALHLERGRLSVAFMVLFAIYLLGCQGAERLARTYLRRWYPDQPQVAIGAAGLWITGTEIPWTSIRAIERRTRRLKAIGVDTIVVQAQAAKRMEPIEIDLSDSVENAWDLYAKLALPRLRMAHLSCPKGRPWRARNPGGSGPAAKEPEPAANSMRSGERPCRRKLPRLKPG